MTYSKGIMLMFAVMAVGCGALLVSISNASGVTQVPERITISTSAPMSGAVKIPIAALKGNKFSINLPSNATTGYGWRLGNKPNASVAKFVDSQYNAPSQAMPGKGGTETWTFQAVGKGTTSIVLEYARPWEKGVAPVKTQTFAVIVQ